GRCLAAEADIDEVGPVRAGKRYRQHGVCLRTWRRARRQHPDHAAGQTSYPEAELCEHVSHQAVLLIAVATAAPAHQFVGQGLWTQVVNRCSDQRIEVFERNSPRVSRHQILQYLEGRLGSAAIIDAVEVCVQIQRHEAILAELGKTPDLAPWGDEFFGAAIRGSGIGTPNPTPRPRPSTSPGDACLIPVKYGDPVRTG